MGFFMSRNHHTASAVVAYWSGYYPIGASGASLFGVASGSNECVVGPITTHFYSYKVDFCFGGDDLESL